MKNQQPHTHLLIMQIIYCSNYYECIFQNPFNACLVKLAAL
jgi:hypothetical protein